MRTIALAICLGVALAGAAGASPPAAGVPLLVAAGLDGPEGIAVGANGAVWIGSEGGAVRRIAPDGTATTVATTGERLAGLAVLRDGRVLAAAFDTGRVWAVDPGSGAVTLFAAGVAGPNALVQRRRGTVLASASLDGTVVELPEGGAPIVRASGLGFPNGLAIGRDRALYVAQTFTGGIARLPALTDGTFGPAEPWATGLLFPDGIAFDRHGNLLVVGGDQLAVVHASDRRVEVLSTDPLLDWPASAAFGRGRGFARKDLLLVNYGLPLGSGTTIVRVPYSNRGASVSR